MEPAADVVHDVELAGMIRAEGGDLDRRINQLALPGNFAVLVAQGPDFARLIVAVNVSAFQVAQSLSMIDVAACDRGRFGVRMDHRGGHNGSRSAFAIRLHDLFAFDDAPTII